MNCSETLIEEEFHKIVIEGYASALLLWLQSKPVLNFNLTSRECYL
jgi:hypothetical protein